MKTFIALGCMATLSSGCMWMASTPSGIREFYRGNAGLITTGKASPDIDDAYHKTQRETDPGIAALRAKLAEMQNGE